MSAPIPSPEVLAGVRNVLANTGNSNRVSDAWRVLAAHGDTYADNAAAVTSSNSAPGSEQVFNHWFRSDSSD